MNNQGEKLQKDRKNEEFNKVDNFFMSKNYENGKCITKKNIGKVMFDTRFMSCEAYTNVKIQKLNFSVVEDS